MALMRTAIKTRWPTRCAGCGTLVYTGSVIYWKRDYKSICASCYSQGKDPETGVEHSRGGSSYANEPEPGSEGDSTKPDPLPPIQDTPTLKVEASDDNKRLIEAFINEVVKREVGGQMATASRDAINSAVKAANDLLTIASEQAIKEAVAKALAQPREIKLTLLSGEQKSIKGTHFYFDRLLKLVNAGMNVFLWGPAGSGKTTAATQVAEALNLTAEIDTLDPSTFRSMIQGFMSPDGKPIHTTFTRCWSNGAIYIADECDNAPGHLQTLFNSALANGYAPLAWGSTPKAAKFGFIGTGNTAGMPTPAFPDRKPMSAAFKDRLYFMHWPVDRNIMRQIAGVNTKPVPTRTMHKPVSKSTWETYVECMMDWAERNAPTLMVTPRASIEGAKALELGESPEDVADGLIFRGCAPDLRAKALSAVRW